MISRGIEVNQFYSIGLIWEVNFGDGPLGVAVSPSGETLVQM